MAVTSTAMTASGDRLQPHAVGLEREVGRLLHAVEHGDRAKRDDDRSNAGNNKGAHYLPRKKVSLCTRCMRTDEKRSSDQWSHCSATKRSATAASSGVLTLKNGSMGSAGQSAMATP